MTQSHADGIARRAAAGYLNHRAAGELRGPNLKRVLLATVAADAFAAEALLLRRAVGTIGALGLAKSSADVESLIDARDTVVGRITRDTVLFGTNSAAAASEAGAARKAGRDAVAVVLTRA